VRRRQRVCRSLGVAFKFSANLGENSLNQAFFASWQVGPNAKIELKLPPNFFERHRLKLCPPFADRIVDLVSYIVSHELAPECIFSVRQLGSIAIIHARQFAELPKLTIR
jgi:hypothetical protein